MIEAEDAPLGAGHRRVVAVVAVRMSSRRLPGKAMRPLLGRPVLGHVVDRLRRARGLDGLWIATSGGSDDDPVADWASAEGVDLYRGPLADLAARILGAGRAAGADAVVRISGDSPLIDPALVGRAVRMYRTGTAELVTNVFPRRSHPIGQSVEVIAVAALARACAAMTEASEREHVTPWFYADPSRARIASFEAASPHPTLQLSVDTPGDLARVEALLRRLQGEPAAHGLDAIMAAATAEAEPA